MTFYGDGALEIELALDGDLEFDQFIFDGEYGSFIEVSHHDTYKGEYVVTPKVEEETLLATNGLLMTDDVRVLEIPYFETINDSDGYTVYIGGGE